MNLIFLIIASICFGNGINAATGWGVFILGFIFLGGIKIEFWSKNGD